MAWVPRRDWGAAASPVLHDGRLYVVNDNEAQSFVAAYDTATGDELWRTNRDERSNWATPFVWENDVRTEIVTSGSGGVRSYGLDGELLWELSGMSTLVIHETRRYEGRRSEDASDEPVAGRVTARRQVRHPNGGADGERKRSVTQGSARVARILRAVGITNLDPDSTGAKPTKAA